MAVIDDTPDPTAPTLVTMTDVANPRAFAVVYDRYASDVVRTADAIVRDRQTAEDVAHDVFLALWRRPDRFDAGRGSLGSYLCLMARSRALDVWRTTAAGSRATRRLEHDVALAPAAEDGAAVAERAASTPAIRAAVRRLPREQREAVGLVYWGGLTAAEVAAHAGIPLGTAKSRLRLALARLAKDAAAEVPTPA